MILTCPECASRYFVDDAKVGPQGRTVRCANCGHRWHAEAPPPPKAPAPVAPIAPAVAEPAPLPEDLAFVEPAVADAEAVEADVEAPTEAPVVIAPPRPAKPREARDGAVASGLIWAALAIALGVLITAVIVFRAEVVRALPRTASAYAAVGLAVNPVGLVIEDIRARPSLQDGHAALTVTGVLRNVEGREVMAPPLRVSLLNPDGKTVAGKIAAADDPLIPAGESRHFEIELLDPPSTSKDLEVSFVLDGAGPAPVKASAPAAATGEPAHGDAPASAETPRLRVAPPAEAPHAAPAAAEHH